MDSSIGKRIVDVEFSRRKFVKTALLSAIAATSITAGANIDFAEKLAVSKQQLNSIAIIADTLLPKTETPSATDVGAHIFVIEFVNDAKGREFSAHFYRGLDSLKDQLESAHGKPLQKISIEDISTFLRTVLAAANESDSYWFLFRFKQLLLVGWALCKETAESAFAYQGGFYQYLPSTQSSQIIMGNYIDKEYLVL